MRKIIRRNRFSLTRKHPVERRVIRIAFPSGKYRDVDAHVIGPLAVHRDCDVPNALGVNWCVTYVRTGSTVTGAKARATFRQAMKIARECTGLDWEFGEFGEFGVVDDALANSDVVCSVRRAVREAGVRAGLKLRKGRS